MRCGNVGMRQCRLSPHRSEHTQSSPHFSSLKAVLFKELNTSFHPQIIYVVASTVDEVLKCFFSVDCNISFTILVSPFESLTLSVQSFAMQEHQQVRLIVNNDQAVDQFLSQLHSRLKDIAQSAHELYNQLVNDDKTAG